MSYSVPTLISCQITARWGVRSLITLVLLLGYYCPAAHGATSTNNIEFANLLPAPGTIQAAANKKLSVDRQEIYRKRVAIPDAVSRIAPLDSRISLINGQKYAAPVHPVPHNTIGKVFDVVFFTVIVLLAGGLLARRFMPQLLQELDQRYNPWAASPVGARGTPAFVRSEEAPFGEFMAAFRAGPPAPNGEIPVAADPVREFYARAKKRLAAQRGMLQEITSEANDAARKKLLVNLYFDLGVLKDDANLPEVLPFWQLASGLEGLLKELMGKIRNATPSTLRTVQTGLDVLGSLGAGGHHPDLLSARPLKFLVVDDDLISRQALSLSLKKAFSQPDVAVDSITALAHTDKQAYDVIFLDVQMPGMDGFELCQKIHNSDLNRSTPIVFVTGHSDFDARVKSTLIGGNDLLGKPFLIFEITVKALTLALQGRLHSQSMPLPAPREIAPPIATMEVSAPAADVSRFISDPALNINRRQATVATPAALNDAARAFLNRAAENLGPLRNLCDQLAVAPDAVGRQSLLADCFLRINSLLTNNDVVHPAYQLSHALESLTRKVLEDTKHSTPSVASTISTAVDLLEELCLPGLSSGLGVNPPIRLLVVDDDLVARRALTGALQIAFKKPESAESGEAALDCARDEQFDVIFLDLQMPGMDGFETCARIKESELNSDTPIVFVTGQSDYAARAQASRTGGNDLVAKPFLTAEIQVKALTFALRSRLKRPALAPLGDSPVPVSVP